MNDRLGNSVCSIRNFSCWVADLYQNLRNQTILLGRLVLRTGMAQVSCLHRSQRGPLPFTVVVCTSGICGSINCSSSTTSVVTSSSLKNSLANAPKVTVGKQLRNSI